MGLSDSERFEKIVYSISGIKQNSRKLSPKYSELKSLCDNLWFNLLKGESNDSLWLTGGQFDQYFFDKTSLLAIAFGENAIEAIQDEQEEDSENVRLSNFISLSYIINDCELGSIINIHQWVDNLTYALCRHQDEFLKTFSDLNKNVRDIQGELFEIISKNSSFYKTWLIKNIINKCLDLWSDDVVTTWFKSQYIYHLLRLRGDHDLKELQDTYFYLQNKTRKDIKIETRLLILLVLCGRKYHFEYKFENLLELVESHNGKSNDKICVKNLTEAFKCCKDQDNLRESRGSYTSWCHLSQQKID